jgi:hypothetical protein
MNIIRTEKKKRKAMTEKKRSLLILKKTTKRMSKGMPWISTRSLRK